MAGVRQHVNPLGLFYMQPRSQRIEIPESLQHDVHAELGCADGHFSFELARLRPSSFVVGLEIRRALVDRNETRARRDKIENLRFGYVNMNVDLDRIFNPRSVHMFHLLFPDPWFKARHQKRRVLDSELCNVMAEQLVHGGELHFASDIYEVALAALQELEADDVQALGFRNMAGAWSFSREAPVPVKSRRELTTERRGQRVWRLRFRLLGNRDA